VDVRRVVESQTQVGVVDAAQTAVRPMSIFALPSDIRNYCIYPLLSKNERGFFARTCRQAEKEIAVARLLHCAVHALPSPYALESNTAAQRVASPQAVASLQTAASPQTAAQPVDKTRLVAVDILKSHPELLFESRGAVVRDHYGRCIMASPYRLLLGAGDVWAVQQIHEFIIPQIENGKALAEAEFRAQFPDCPCPSEAEFRERSRHNPCQATPGIPEETLYDARNRAQIAAVKKQLQVIVAKITADPCTLGEATLEETRQAITDLCQIFAPKVREIIRTGLHFPLGVMNEIQNVFRTQYLRWSIPQVAFFARTVIGAAEAASTAVDGQCYKNGLIHLDFNYGPDRSNGLFCCHSKDTPLALTPFADRLGRTAFVDLSQGDLCVYTSNPRLNFFDVYVRYGREPMRQGWDCALLGKVEGWAEWTNLCAEKATVIWNYYDAATHTETNALSRSS
jgi:hypothetical protein